MPQISDPNLLFFYFIYTVCFVWLVNVQSFSVIWQEKHNLILNEKEIFYFLLEKHFSIFFAV